MANINNTWYSTELVDGIVEPSPSTVRSRYDIKEQLQLKNGNTVIRNMRSRDLVPSSSPYDTIHRVTAGEKYRPDIIAKNAYGDPRYAWIILSANNISDVFDLDVGAEIIIPSASVIFGSGGVL